MFYWIATFATALLYGVPAVLLLMGNPHFMSELAALGYPAYFAVLLASAKFTALIVILAPRLPLVKEWAYAGLIFDAAAAIASREQAHGDLLLTGPSVLVGAVALASWALRPKDRRLAFTVTS